ncbi:DotU family type IV/VI secretion system protein, partial [Acinetobacter baumannii]
LIFLLIFALLTFAGLRFMLNNQNDKALSNYQNVISAPQEQAHITIYLP